MLASFAFVAAVTAARPPDGTYRYALRVSGTPVATSTVVLTKGDSGVQVRDAISMPAASLSGTATTLYDPATLVPTGYHADFSVSGETQHVDVSFPAGSATMSVGSQHFVMDAAPGAPLMVPADNFAGTLVMLPALLHASGADAFTIAVLKGRGTTVALSVDRSAHPARPSGVPAGDASLVVNGGGLQEIYWYDPGTFVLDEMDVPAQNAQFVLTSHSTSVSRVPEPSPQPTALPTPAPHFTSRDVTFRSGDGTRLAGTLTVPRTRRAKMPALVLVHGSGPENRDERIGPNPVFLQLSNALSNAGYIVLRYDKRGIGASGGGAATTTRPQLIADIEAAYRFLRAQPRVDARRVFLLGHSEGGELIPSVAAVTPGIAGLVLMAPPSRPLAAVIMQQTLASVPAAQRAKTASAETRFLQNVRDGKKRGPGMAWLRTSLDIDPRVDIARVRVPMLILQGADDAQVLVKDLPGLVAAAREHDRDVTVRVLSGDNHLFMPVTGGKTQTPLQALHQYLTVPGRIDPRVTSALLSWLKTHSA